MTSIIEKMRRNSLLSSLFVFILMFGLLTSCKDEDNDSNPIGKSGTVVTGGVVSTGCTYAVLSGYVNTNLLTTKSRRDPSLIMTSFGMEVSSSEQFAAENLRSFICYGIRGNRFEVPVQDLSANKTYYYRAYVEVNLVRYYGVIQSFTTSELPLTCSVGAVDDITFTSVTTKVNFNELESTLSSADHIISGIAYTTNYNIFTRTQSLWTSDELESAGVCFKEVSYKSGEISVQVGNLQPSKTYYYRSFSRGGETCILGPVKSFTTLTLEPSQLVTLDATGVSSISAILKGTTTLQATIPQMYGDVDINYGMSYVEEAEHDQSVTDNFPYEPFSNTLTGRIVHGVNGDTIVSQVTTLKPDTKYLYRPFISVGSSVIMGDVKSFITKRVNDVLQIVSVDARFETAKIVGRTLLPEYVTGIIYRLYCMEVGKPASLYETTMTVDGNLLKYSLSEYASANKSYECWIVAENMKGKKVMESERKQFQTKNPGDYIVIDGVTEITSTSAVIRGSSTTDEFSLSARVEYHLNVGDFTGHTEWAQVEGNRFYYKFTDLQPGTTYYYRVVVNGCGIDYPSEIKSFTTLP